MKRTPILFLSSIALLALFAACKGGHENAITNPSSGTGVLTGQVFPVGDLAGSSPAGITVTSKGQYATTDPAGRFTFVGLTAAGGLFTTMSTSNDLTFTFTRNDGINAQGSVAANAASIEVQLQKRSATIVSTGQAKRELEGPITAVSASSITVNNASSGGPVTAAINSSTVITKGNQTYSATQLQVGWTVHIKATVNTDGSLTAFEILVQNTGNGGDGGGQTQQLEGPIVSVSKTSITVNNASTGGPVTAAITSSTVIRKGNQTLTTNDLHVGDRVHVSTSGSGTSLTAVEIIVQNPA